MNYLLQNFIDILLNKNISINDIQLLEDILDINENYKLFLIITDKNNISEHIKNDYIILYSSDISEIETLFLFCKKDFDLSLINSLISICIPTYYSKERESILSYSIEEWTKSKNINLNLVEFIIVENGSNYYNHKYFEKYNLNIKLFNIEESNLGKARKISVEESNSKIILLVNDDTIANFNLIEKHLIYQIINYKKNIAILGKFIFHNNVLDNDFMKIINEYSKIFIQNKLENNKEYNNYKLFITNNISIKKELILKVGNFSEDFISEGEDTDLGYRLLNNGLNIIFKEDIISHHLHKHDINSYLNLLKRRLFVGAKIDRKYSENKYINNLENYTFYNIIASKIFINYIRNNYENDLFLKYYLDFISICSYTIANLDVLEKLYNKKIFNYEINYLKDNKKILSLIHKKNKKYLDILKFENYYLYDENSFISDVFQKKFEYLNILEIDFIPLLYTNELLLNIKNNIDQSIEVLFGSGFSFDIENKNIIPEKNTDIFIGKIFLIKNTDLLESKIIDINKNLFQKNIFNILLPFTSIKIQDELFIK